jgi:hypothetical protein
MENLKYELRGYLTLQSTEEPLENFSKILKDTIQNIMS